MFGSLGLPELLVVLTILGIFVAPLWRILRRAGLPPLIALAAFIPPAGALVLWYIALARWPAVERNP
jgi:prepilin-type N-terminal cleavage/methylation domain-containing protein